MPDLSSLSLKLDERRGRCRAIVETPRGSRCKLKFDPESGLFKLNSVLPEGMAFPFDFGFVPSTLGEDGDPVDIVILMDAPTTPGCLVDVKIIGVIEAEQTEKGKKKPEDNSRLVGVAVEAWDAHEKLSSLDALGDMVLSQWEEFFTNYDRQHGKKFRATGIGGPKAALQHLRKGIQGKKRKSTRRA